MLKYKMCIKVLVLNLSS